MLTIRIPSSVIALRAQLILSMHWCWLTGRLVAALTATRRRCCCSCSTRTHSKRPSTRSRCRSTDPRRPSSAERPPSCSNTQLANVLRWIVIQCSLPSSSLSRSANLVGGLDADSITSDRCCFLAVTVTKVISIAPQFTLTLWVSCLQAWNASVDHQVVWHIWHGV